MFGQHLAQTLDDLPKNVYHDKFKGDIDNIYSPLPRSIAFTSQHHDHDQFHGWVGWESDRLSHVKWWIFRGRVMNSFWTSSETVPV